MIESWMVVAVFLPSPLVFVAGFVAGKQHVRRLAKHGGEDSYPRFVQETVEKYRQHREWVRYD